MLWARASCGGPLRFEYGTDPDFLALDGCADAESVVEGGDIIPSKATITGLLDGTPYHYRVCPGTCVSAGEQECQARGTFRTPHASGRRGLRFGVSSCFEGRMRPFVSIRNAPARNLDFFVALGDTAYADHRDACGGPATSLEEFRCKHRLAYAPWMSPEDNMLAQLRASTAVFANMDDHEVDNDFAGGEGCGDDCYNDSDQFEAGLQAFEEYNPTVEETYGQTGDPRTAGERKLYRYRTFGSDAAILMLDTRSFRDGPEAGQQVCDHVDALDATPACDYIELERESYQSSVTMLGAVQLEELLANLSDAEARGVVWKFIMVPEPIQNLGPVATPDRFEGYAYERAVILDFIEENCIGNVVFISGDIHGSIANNLVYGPFFGGTPADFVTTLRKYSSSWDISTGPGAYEKPYGALVSEARKFFCAKPEVNDLIDGLCGCDRGDFDAMTAAQKDRAIEDFMDCVLGVLNYGVDPYELPASDGGYSAAEAEGFMDRVPRVMGRFEVEPRCGCQQLACVADDACGNGCICDALGEPCVANAACLRGRCAILADEPIGVCQAVCGDGICDAGTLEEECGRNDSGVSCITDCGRCPNGHLCIVDGTCASGRCSAGRCAPCLTSGQVCGRDGACCSDSCRVEFPQGPNCD